MVNNKLTRKEKKEFFKKLQRPVGRQIKRANKDLTYGEIYQKCGLPPNRSCAIANNTEPLTEQALILLIGGGVVKLEELRGKVNLTEGEENYLNTFSIYADKDVQREYLLAKEKGLDPAEVLRKARKKL